MKLNRREFLRTLIVGAVGSAVDIEFTVDQLLQRTNDLDDGQFVYFVTICLNFHVCNPRQCAYIDDIIGD